MRVSIAWGEGWGFNPSCNCHDPEFIFGRAPWETSGTLPVPFVPKTKFYVGPFGASKMQENFSEAESPPRTPLGELITLPVAGGGWLPPPEEPIPAVSLSSLGLQLFGACCLPPSSFSQLKHWINAVSDGTANNFTFHISRMLDCLRTSGALTL